MGNLLIGPFIPTEIKKGEKDIEKILEYNLGKSFFYASRGRNALKYILKSFNVKKVIIPAYICPTVSEAIESLCIPYYYCDINTEDLNISFESFKIIQEKTNADCVIVPSLYGNPADVDIFQQYCRDHNIIMIDDGAQSFGAKVNNQYVSTFGNAGLFAFAPGKSTTLAMGALYWSENNNTWSDSTKHTLVHKLIYINFYINRVFYYKHTICRQVFGKIFNAFINRLENNIDMSKDEMAKFEYKYISGVIEQVLDQKYQFRNNYYEKFYDTFNNNELFYIAKSLRGIPIPHKIVLIMDSVGECDAIEKYLNKQGIYVYRGYKLPSNCQNLENVNSVIGKIIEIPIENNQYKMDYMMSCIKNYIEKRNEK